MRQQTKQIVKETIETVVIAFILAMVIRTFVVQAFKIPSGSMRPTLEVGDRILVSKFIYRFNEPRRGDVIVFRSTEDAKKDFIKRLAGKGGETIEIRDGKIYINDNPADSSELNSKYYYNRDRYGAEGQKVYIPENNYYALGDNSASSRDSRYWGFVPKKNLLGKAFLIYWPVNRIRMIK